MAPTLQRDRSKTRTMPPTCWINLISIPDFLGGSLYNLLEAFVVDVGNAPFRNLIPGEAMRIEVSR